MIHQRIFQRFMHIYIFFSPAFNIFNCISRFLPFRHYIQLKNGASLMCSQYRALMKSTIYIFYVCVSECGIDFWRKWNSNDIERLNFVHVHSDLMIKLLHIALRLLMMFASCVRPNSQYTCMYRTCFWCWDVKHRTFLINYLGQVHLANAITCNCVPSSPVYHILLWRSPFILAGMAACAQLVISAVVFNSAFGNEPPRKNEETKKMLKWTVADCTNEHVLLSVCVATLSLWFQPPIFTRQVFFLLSFFLFFLLSWFGYSSVLHTMPIRTESI